MTASAGPPWREPEESFAPALRKLVSWLSHRSWASRWPHKVETWTSGKGGSRSLASSGFVIAENFPPGRTSLAVCKAKLPQQRPPRAPPRLRWGRRLGSARTTVRRTLHAAGLALGDPECPPGLSECRESCFVQRESASVGSRCCVNVAEHRLLLAPGVSGGGMLKAGRPRAPLCRRLPCAPGKGCKEPENKPYFQHGPGDSSSRLRAGAPG